jgi:hypothetical protein
LESWELKGKWRQAGGKYLLCLWWCLVPNIDIQRMRVTFITCFHVGYVCLSRMWNWGSEYTYVIYVYLMNVILYPYPSGGYRNWCYALRGEARTCISYLFLLLYVICFWNCCTQCYVFLWSQLISGYICACVRFNVTTVHAIRFMRVWFDLQINGWVPHNAIRFSTWKVCVRYRSEHVVATNDTQCVLNSIQALLIGDHNVSSRYWIENQQFKIYRTA